MNLHPMCRSTTIPSIDNDYVSTRTARLGDGKTYEVPSNMNYKKWAELNDIE